jgi:hypothetical protein
MTSRLQTDAGRHPDDVGLLEHLTGDGLGLLTVVALGLIAAGGFAWFLAVSDQLLPHDLTFLTIPEEQLRTIADGRLVEFMAHDRAAFGGTLVSIGVLYLWLVRFPLAQRRAWAWWVLAIGGSLGFLTFLSYLATGYLDTWHGLATLVLLPLFFVGLVRTRRTLEPPTGVRTLTVASRSMSLRDRDGLGRALLLLTAFGMLVAGVTIVTIGSFVVFVPQDLAYLGLDRAALDAIDPRLVPLIAHDRAGFGGALATTGFTVMGVVYAGRPSRSLWEALLLSGLAGFGAAIGVHALIGYDDLSHVGPAILGAAIFAAGMILSARSMLGRPESHAGDDTPSGPRPSNERC